jgi:hypothetical protein
MAGFVVACLLAGQAMAATGCCWIAPLLPSADIASSAPLCPDHAGDSDSGTDGKPACPAEQPTPQSRAVDLPGAQAVVAIVAVALTPIAAFDQRLPPALTATAVPPPPLYVRPHSLRL